MKLKAAFVSSALALAASLATAGPVVFDQKALTGNASTTYTFEVATDSMFSGWLKATSNLAGNLAIESVLLSKDGVSYQFDGSHVDDDMFLSVVAGTGSTPGKKGPIPNYSLTYTLSPVLLTAGDWEMTVNFGSYGKYNSMVAGEGSLSAVPEPQSLALVLASLGAMVWVGRRRAAASHAPR